MYAAAISPCEWPTTAAGSTPQDRHRAASDTITANDAGWTTSTRSKDGAPSAPRSTSVSDQSTNGDSAFSQASTAARNSGAESSSSRPMPAHWAPWPGKTNTAPESSWPGAVPRTTEADSPASARAHSPASSSARPPPRTTARRSKAARVTADEKPRSSGESVSSEVSRAASRAAWPRSATSDRADRTSAAGASSWRAGPVGAASDVGSEGSVRGACSRMTCALVPLMPKEETAARRGRPVSGQSTACVTSSTAPADQSTCGVGSSTCRVWGTTPARRAITVLMTPPTPAAACV